MAKRRKKIIGKLLVISIPTALLPLVIIMSLLSFQIFTHLTDQYQRFYSTILAQISYKFNIVYEQYGRTLANMMEIPEVDYALNHPPYKNEAQEREISRQLIGDEIREGGLRNVASEKIEGFLYIYELDRSSMVSGDEYMVHTVTIRSENPDINRILDDPLFRAVRSDNTIRMIYGKFKEGVVPGYGSEHITSFVFPIYYEPPVKKTDTFDKFFLVLLKQDFVSYFYENIEGLNTGTLYVLDRFDNIISRNHPSSNDYYEYDEEAGRYLLSEDDNADDPSEEMSYTDYQLLNTNSDILKSEVIRDSLERLVEESGSVLDEDDTSILQEKIYVTFNKLNYMVILGYDPNSGVKLVFFYPVVQILKPILTILSVLIIITVIVMLVVIAIGYFFSKSFTNPIQILVSATKTIAGGNYNQLIETRSHDEIGDLADNFNKMIKNIKSFQDKLLSMEREKSELDLASRIQTCLLPPIPVIKHYDLTAIMLPAEQVGGDYFDIIDEKDGRVWLGIGDVSGHGLASGLIMMMAQTAFNTVLLKNPGIDSNDLIAQVNKTLYQNVRERLGEDDFMTMSFVVADPDGKVNYAGAHLDILVYRDKTREVERIKTDGLWLGLLPDIDEHLTQKSFKLAKNDVVLLFTDGLIEAMNEQNEQYDMHRLLKILTDNGDKDINKLKDIIIEDVFKFLHQQKDDITLVLARKR
jgi:serine phosphatase RsbU (regulator of sigma subunit)